MEYSHCLRSFFSLTMLLTVLLLKLLLAGLPISSALADDITPSSTQQPGSTLLANNKETSKRETGYNDRYGSASFIKGGVFTADYNSYGAGNSYGSTGYRNVYGSNGYVYSGNQHAVGYGSHGKGGSYGPAKFNTGYAGASYGTGNGGNSNYGNSYGLNYNTFTPIPTSYNRPLYPNTQYQSRDPKFLKVKFHKHKESAYPAVPAYNSYQSTFNYGNGYSNYGSNFGSYNYKYPSYALQRPCNGYGLTGGAYGIGPIYRDQTYGTSYGYGIAGTGFTGPFGLGGWYPTYSPYGGRLVNDLLPYTGPPSNGYSDALYKREAKN